MPERKGDSLRFNPLPSPKQGETVQHRAQAVALHVSIRSPHRSKGRPEVMMQIAARMRVSIRSPHRSKGRPAVVQRSIPKLRVSIRSPHRSKGRHPRVRGCRRSTPRFNPLPSPKQGETRGHAAVGIKPWGFNPLPSPKQGETDHQKVGRARVSNVSIRSPHRSKGRLQQALSLMSYQLVSIRSPHRSKGRPVGVSGCGGEFIVSIRSPHRSKGRRARICVAIRGPFCFNPLPSPKQGETPNGPPLPWRGLCFNPLPSPKQGETP